MKRKRFWNISSKPENKTYFDFFSHHKQLFKHWWKTLFVDLPDLLPPKTMFRSGYRKIYKYFPEMKLEPTKNSRFFFNSLGYNPLHIDWQMGGHYVNYCQISLLINFRHVVMFKRFWWWELLMLVTNAIGCIRIVTDWKQSHVRTKTYVVNFDNWLLALDHGMQLAPSY